jgi:hypothetical protein
MIKHDLVIFYGALVAAVCLMVFGIASYPDSSQFTNAASASVQPARYIVPNH